MARAPLKFRQTDVTRLVKAARAAGLDVARIKITLDGSIETFPATDNVPVLDEAAFDQWKASKNARSIEGH